MSRQTALITGASSGIGASFARQLAASDHDLILVARSADKLEVLAAELCSAHGVRVDVLPTDLAQPAPGAALYARVTALGRQVDVLINNAGFGAAGAFHGIEPERHQQMLALNIAAVVDLVQAFVPDMVRRRQGAILNVASLAGFQPMPYMSVYAASKAFVLSFSEGLWGEYRQRGIRVLAVCPGPVDTPFFEAAGDNLRAAVPSSLMKTPDDVARAALKALDRGDSSLVPGVTGKLVAVLPRLLPRKLLAWSVGRTMRR